MKPPIEWLAPLSAQASLRKSGVNSLLWLATSQTVKILLMLTSTMVLVRLLSPQDFGLLAMAATVTNFFMLFKDAGLTTAVVQQQELSHRQVSTLFWLNLAVALGLTGLSLIAAPLLAMFYHEPKLTPILMVMALGFLFSGLGVQHDALLRRTLNFRKLAILDVASTTAGVVVAIIMAYTGWSWWALVGQQLMQTLAYSAGCWWLCGWRPTRIWHWLESRSQFKFGAQITGFNFVNYFSRYADNILIGRYWGAGSLGMYSKAYSTLMAPMRQVSGPLGSTLQPMLGRLRSEPVRYRNAYLSSYRPAVLIMLPVGVMMFMLPEAIVGLLFGKGWEGVIPVLQWMGLGVATQLVGDSTGTLLLSQQRGKDFMIIGAATSTLSVLSFVVGLPFGIGAVAACYVLGYVCLQMPLFNWWTGRTGPVSAGDIYSLLALPLWCAGWAMPALLGLRMVLQPSIWQLLAGGAVTGLCILAALVCVADGRALLREMWSLIRKKAV